MRCHSGRVGVPKQLVITTDPSDTAELVKKQGLNLPLGTLFNNYFLANCPFTSIILLEHSYLIVVKPLVADGTAKSHHMYLAYNADCLASLDPPFVLQEFVNHGKCQGMQTAFLLSGGFSANGCLFQVAFYSKFMWSAMLFGW